MENNSEEEDIKTLLAMTAPEVVLDASLSVLDNGIAVLQYLLDGASTIAEIARLKHMDLSWQEMTYKEKRAFSESVRTNLQVMQHFTQELSSVAMFMIDMLENDQRGMASIEAIRARIDQMHESTQILVNSKSEYLNGIEEEDD